MKKIVLVGLLIVFLMTTGCWHTFSGALIGGGIGGAIGGGRGAAIGAAIGAGVGHELDAAEMKAAGISPYQYGYYRYGYRDEYEVNCSIFPTPNEQAQCERGKRYAERKLQYERERRAYDYGRYGY